jgi:hypothetical protein
MYVVNEGICEGETDIKIETVLMVESFNGSITQFQLSWSRMRFRVSVASTSVTIGSAGYLRVSLASNPSAADVRSHVAMTVFPFRHCDGNEHYVSPSLCFSSEISLPRVSPQTLLPSIYTPPPSVLCSGSSTSSAHHPSCSCGATPQSASVRPHRTQHVRAGPHSRGIQTQRRSL